MTIFLKQSDDGFSTKLTLNFTADSFGDNTHTDISLQADIQ
jgi:hypothetical protein